MFLSENFLVKVMSYTTNFDPVFSYVPESYIETLIECFHSLRRGDPPFSFTESEAKASQFGALISFLILHFNDKRIVNPGKIPRL
jgi:Kip1 ubiquitination-promoting complex protein 1